MVSQDAAGNNRQVFAGVPLFSDLSRPWSLAEVEPRPALVRSSPESGHSPTRQRRPLWAKLGSISTTIPDAFRDISWHKPTRRRESSACLGRNCDASETRIG